MGAQGRRAKQLGPSCSPLSRATSPFPFLFSVHGPWSRLCLHRRRRRTAKPSPFPPMDQKGSPHKEQYVVPTEVERPERSDPGLWYIWDGRPSGSDPPLLVHSKLALETANPLRNTQNNSTNWTDDSRTAETNQQPGAVVPPAPPPPHRPDLRSASWKGSSEGKALTKCPPVLRGWSDSASDLSPCKEICAPGTVSAS